MFEEGLIRIVPNAARVAISATSGSLAWRVLQTDCASAFVVLFIHDTADRFTIELCWSEKNRIPPCNDMMPDQDPIDGQMRFRLSRLWQPTGFEVWYDLQYDADHPDSGPHSVFTPEEPCIDRVPVKVERALTALKRYGLPYLREALGLPT
jgi:hypothetical protein